MLFKSTGTTASNIDQTVNTSWGGLQATDATHAYDLSAEAGTASNNGKFVGTGYNDTFFATAAPTLTTVPALDVQLRHRNVAGKRRHGRG
ncbi:putative adhesin for cattle intestine colonization [Escherichia coli]|uniref:Putative adhesin for cattle intestine colonization n=1 Tax=Escherichia coli TaxID=562 RepID=A0A376LJI6_ECOLX|nr:putative adhesin for cattle intestine colonization [Escherichia coli]